MNYDHELRRHNIEQLKAATHVPAHTRQRGIITGQNNQTYDANGVLFTTNRKLSYVPDRPYEDAIILVPYDSVKKPARNFEQQEEDAVDLAHRILVGRNIVTQRYR